MMTGAKGLALGSLKDGAKSVTLLTEHITQSMEDTAWEFGNTDFY